MTVIFNDIIIFIIIITISRIHRMISMSCTYYLNMDMLVCVCVSDNSLIIISLKKNNY